MKRLSATLLALGLSAAVGTASAQNYGGYTNQQNAIYDWARVVRVDPVIDSRYSNGNTATTDVEQQLLEQRLRQQQRQSPATPLGPAFLHPTNGG